MSIKLNNLKKYYNVKRDAFFSFQRDILRALDGITFKISAGETVALVGESGCGKTTIAKLILRLEKPTSGTVYFDGVDINDLKKKELSNYRRSIQSVFQNPYASLDPRMRICSSIAETIKANGLMTKKESANRVTQVLNQVGLNEECKSLYPHEFSGGQRQRVAIARAIASMPHYIVLDEPVSALDVSISAQILNLLKDLQDELGVGYLLITHDLATAVHLSHRIEIIYAGKVVENIISSNLVKEALHPYTKLLLKVASPSKMGKRGKDLVSPGEVPDRTSNFSPGPVVPMPTLPLLLLYMSLPLAAQNPALPGPSSAYRA